MIEELFKSFEELNTILDNKIDVISVKRSRMTFDMQEHNIITRQDLEIIDNFCGDSFVQEITTFQDTLFISTNDLDDDFFVKNQNNALAKIYSFIIELRSMLCTCPLLEFQISANYIKVFIDVPNLFVKDLASVDKYLQRDGIIESANQRPYLLYVKDW